MIPTQCVTNTNVSRIRIEENGRKVIFLNDNRTRHKVVRNDGCYMVNRRACDHVVMSENVGAAFVELKGTDVKHGVTQIIATLEHWQEEGELPQRLGALIVCRQVPRIDTTIQRLKTEVARRFRAPCRIEAKNIQVQLSAIVGFE